MSNHEYHRNFNSWSGKWVEIDATILWGTSTTPVLQQFTPYTPTTSGGFSAAPTGGFGYVLNVVRNGTGDITINFPVGDSYQRILNLSLGFIPGGLPTAGATSYPTAAAAPATPDWYVKSAQLQPSAGNSSFVRFQLLNGSDVAADPAAGEAIAFSFILEDSTSR